MSLVDYAASSDEDEPQNPADEEQNEQVKENLETRPRVGVPAAGPSSAAPPNNGPAAHAHNRTSISSGPPSSKQTEIVSNQSSDLRLPDASLLLSSPVVPSNLHNASDHSSRVAAAMAESAARKRELNGSSNNPRRKIPKGTLRHSKNVPDTVDGHLLPPQLAGRSNIVTEDISKLFVRKHTNSPTG